MFSYIATVEPEVEIVVDRPFLFVLRNTELNITTLVGRVENPNITTSSFVKPTVPNSTQDTKDYNENSKTMNISEINKKEIDNAKRQSNLQDTEINSSLANIRKRNTSMVITTPKNGKYHIY